MVLTELRPLMLANLELAHQLELEMAASEKAKKAAKESAAREEEARAATKELRTALGQLQADLRLREVHEDVARNELVLALRQQWRIETEAEQAVALRDAALAQRVVFDEEVHRLRRLHAAELERVRETCRTDYQARLASVEMDTRLHRSLSSYGREPLRSSSSVSSNNDNNSGVDDGGDRHGNRGVSEFSSRLASEDVVQRG
eukprot:g3197.t1